MRDADREAIGQEGPGVVLGQAAQEPEGDGSTRPRDAEGRQEARGQGQAAEAEVSPTIFARAISRAGSGRWRPCPAEPRWRPGPTEIARSSRSRATSIASPRRRSQIGRAHV